MKNIISIFAVVFSAVVSLAAQTKIHTKTLPNCEVLDVSALGSMVTIIETFDTVMVSKLTIETELKHPSMGKESVETIYKSGVLGVKFSDHYQTQTVIVTPNKSDDLFRLSVNGTDVEMKRTYILVVPHGTTVIR